MQPNYSLQKVKSVVRAKQEMTLPKRQKTKKSITKSRWVQPYFQWNISLFFPHFSVYDHPIILNKIFFFFFNSRDTRPNAKNNLQIKIGNGFVFPVRMWLRGEKRLIIKVTVENNLCDRVLVKWAQNTVYMAKQNKKGKYNYKCRIDRERHLSWNKNDLFAVPF